MHNCKLLVALMNGLYPLGALCYSGEEVVEVASRRGLSIGLGRSGPFELYYLK